MQKLWEIAPPLTWGLLALSSVCLLAAFILLSHTLVRRKAYGDRWGGWLAPGRLERTVRVGLALLLAGGLLWAVELNAWSWLLAGLAAGTVAFGVLQAVAMGRAKS